MFKNVEPQDSEKKDVPLYVYESSLPDDFYETPAEKLDE